MSETILATEAIIRLAIFLGVLAAMALWEVAAPRRRREIPRVIRWTNNLALVVVDTVILRLSFPILAVGLAVMAAALARYMDNPFLGQTGPKSLDRNDFHGLLDAVADLSDADAAATLVARWGSLRTLETPTRATPQGRRSDRRLGSPAESKTSTPSPLTSNRLS